MTVVWEVAHSLGYVPNAQARRLRAGETENDRGKTGIIIHISHLGCETPIGNDFQARRSQLLEWDGQRRGLYPITYWYHKLKGFQCPPVLNGHVDGAIVGTPHSEVVAILKDKLPTVLMDVPFTHANVGVPMVNLDYRPGFTALFAALREKGHRSVGVVSSKCLSPWLAWTAAWGESL